MSEIVYGVLGASFLWPWNALITASALAKSKLGGHPGLYASYSSTVMIASTLTSLISTSYLAYKPQNFGQRVRYGELIIAIAFLMLGTIGELETEVAWMVCVVLAVCISSFGTALVQNGSLAITQRIPGAGHALALMNGQGVAGVLPPLLPLLVSSTVINALAPITFISVSVLSGLAYVLFSANSNKQYVLLSEESSDESEDTPPSWSKLWELAKQIQGCTVSILLGFIFSLSYPVFANNMEPNSLSPTLFSPLTHLIWNSGDLAGRMICSSPALRINNEPFMMAYALARGLFIILFLILAKLGNPSDLLFLVAMFGYGLSNGHLISSAIAHAPSCVPRSLQPATGGLLGLIIAVGLLFGSVFSFVVVAVL